MGKYLLEENLQVMTSIFWRIPINWIFNIVTSTFSHNKQVLHAPEPFLCSRAKKEHKLHKPNNYYFAFPFHSLKWHLCFNNSCVLKVGHLLLRIPCFRMHVFDLRCNRRRDTGLKWSLCLIHLLSIFKFISENHFHNYCLIYFIM